MLPNINPRMMKQAMKRMGIQQQEINAHEVIIKCEDKDIVIHNPEVSRVNMMGQETFQVIGQAEEVEKEIEISSEDVQTIMDQTNVSEDEAKKALKNSGGDLAKAILSLQDE